MTLTELFEAYARKHLRGKSDNTLRLYRHTIRSFAKFLRRDPTIADLDSDLIEDFMWKVIKSGRSIATANKDRSQLICLWNYAARKRIVDTYPDVPQIAEPEKIPMAWMPDEIDAILSAARVDTREIGGVKGSTWWTAMLLIILDSGERIGAVRSLPRNCLHGEHLLVPAAIRKGKTRDRLYKLSPDCIAAIDKLLRSHTEADLFPFPYTHTYLYRRYRKLLEHAGLPIARANNFHRLRKTVASAVARAGGDPTAALDHSSPKTTKSYLDTRIVGGVQVSEILAAYLKDPILRSSQKTDPKRKTG